MYHMPSANSEFPKASIVFTFRVHSFSEGRNIVKQLWPTKVHSLLLNTKKKQQQKNKKKKKKNR